MATIPKFNQWSYGHLITFQLPVPTSLAAVTAIIYLRKPRSGAVVEKTGVVSDAADTVSYTFVANDLDEYGRWIGEVAVSDGRTMLEQDDGTTRLLFDVLRSARSM